MLLLTKAGHGEIPVRTMALNDVSVTHFVFSIPTRVCVDSIYGRHHSWFLKIERTLIQPPMRLQYTKMATEEYSLYNLKHPPCCVDF